MSAHVPANERPTPAPDRDAMEALAEILRAIREAVYAEHVDRPQVDLREVEPRGRA